jgi:hypothetical protein
VGSVAQLATLGSFDDLQMSVVAAIDIFLSRQTYSCTRPAFENATLRAPYHKDASQNVGRTT